ARQLHRIVRQFSASSGALTGNLSGSAGRYPRISCLVAGFHHAVQDQGVAPNTKPGIPFQVVDARLKHDEVVSRRILRADAELSLDVRRAGSRIDEGTI